MKKYLLLLLLLPITVFAETTVIGNIQEIGTEVCFDDQCFNVFKVDNDEIYLLSKYNLNVGNNLYPNVRVGIQDEHVLGKEYMNGMPTEICYGCTKFNEGWLSNVYEEALIKGHVDNYVEILRNEYNIDVISSRIPYIDEIREFANGENVYYLNRAESAQDKPWLWNTSYWLDMNDNQHQSLLDSDLNFICYRIRQDSYIETGDNNNNNHFGVRPIIVVNKSMFEQSEEPVEPQEEIKEEVKEEVKGVEEVTENPETGKMEHTFVKLFFLAVAVLVFYICRDKSYFNQ